MSRKAQSQKSAATYQAESSKRSGARVVKRRAIQQRINMKRPTLTDAEIAQIRLDRRGMTYKQLAEKYGVTEGSLLRYCKGIVHNKGMRNFTRRPEYIHNEFPRRLEAAE